MMEIRATANAGEVVLEGDAPPTRIQLLRMGENPKRDGGKPYLVADRAHADAIVAASNAYHKSTRPMVDYDHQSVYGAKNGVGGRAPAAAWMTGLVANDDGIFADVEWTAAAAAAVAAKEYRYISPYFGHRPDGRVTRIFNAALTNRPELELSAVASQSDPDMIEDVIPMKSIATALGLAEGASETDIVAAVNKITAERAATCSALGLAANASLAEIRTAASAAGAVDQSKFVPMAEFNALRTKIDGIDETRVTASVDAAILAGKVTPASRDWALGYARKDEAGFKEFVGKQPEIVAEGAEERRAAAIASDTLTDEEKAICSQTGVSPENFIKSRKGMAK